MVAFTHEHPSRSERPFPRALAGLVDDPAELLELIRRSQDPKFGDYQANLAMPLGKRLRRPPRDVAAEIVGRLDVADLCQPPEIAGPGFINLRISDDWLVERLSAAVGDPRLGVPPVAEPRTFVIDFSAPNVAKPMHVGHIRSTVIGDALCRVLRFLGHKVISDNHIGDWGTQFGMILYGYKHFRDAEAYRQNPVEELARLYRLVRQLMDYQESSRQEPSPTATTADSCARIALSARTSGHRRGRAGRNRQAARRRCRKPPPVGRIPAVLRRRNRADVQAARRARSTTRWARVFTRTGWRALVEELLQPRHRPRKRRRRSASSSKATKTPMIVRKKDGAFLYGTTDLATIRYRMETWRPDAILYVVDHRQSLHFQQLFAAARLLGYDDVELQHVSFGTVLGDDGRPFKTRSGDTVGLEGLLDEAVRRALEIVSANDDAKPDGPRAFRPQQRRQIAETVGIAALKYADLSQNRTSDYVFSYDKMLAMNGNTATYMQYAYARVRSIFAKGNVDVDALRACRRADSAATRRPNGRWRSNCSASPRPST